MKSKNAKGIIFIIFALVLAVGCSNFVKNTTSTLETTAITVDTTMKVANDLYQRGVINDETKDQIIEVHDKYRLTHQILCELLKVYKTIEDNKQQKKEIKEQIGEAIARLIWCSSEITRIVTEFLNADDISYNNEVRRMAQILIDEHPPVHVAY